MDVRTVVPRGNENPSRRTGHVSVSFGKHMIVWGGYSESFENFDERYFPSSELWFYSFDREEWHVTCCTSTLHPPPTTGSSAVVIRSHMYLFGGFVVEVNNCTNQLYRLDLETLEWEQLRPSSPLPGAVDKFTSWAYNDKLYIFGGFGPPTMVALGFEFVSLPHSFIQRGWSNQFFEYNPETNTWSKPNFTGMLPRSRAAHAAALVGAKVYIFGGRHNNIRLNDLHCLDMDSMCWEEKRPDGILPEGRSWHTLSAVSDNLLMLYGGFSQDSMPLSDCWLYNIEHNLWQRLKLPFISPRVWHSAAVSPDKEVLIHGGFCAPPVLYDLRIVTQDIIVIKVTPKSLYRQCIESMMQMPELYPLWSSLPLVLQKDLQKYLEFLREQNDEKSSIVVLY